MARSLLIQFYWMLFATILVSCQTAPHRRFEAVRVGMDKSTVLELAGGPLKKMRYQGKDRWLYLYRSDDGADQIREVHFEFGRAVYVGGRVTPPMSAEEQDKINEQVLKEDREREEAEKARYEEEVGIIKLQSKSERAKPDDLDLRLKDSMYGTDHYQRSQREKSKRAPEFEPVD